MIKCQITDFVDDHLWISFTFSSCLSHYFENSLLIAGLCLELSCKCMLNYANTLLSGGISLLTQDCFASLWFISQTGHFCTHYAYFPCVLCAVLHMCRTNRTLNGDRLRNELLTCKDFVDVSLLTFEHLCIVFKSCLTSAFEHLCIVFKSCLTSEL